MGKTLFTVCNLSFLAALAGCTDEDRPPPAPPVTCDTDGYIGQPAYPHGGGGVCCKPSIGQCGAGCGNGPCNPDWGTTGGGAGSSGGVPCEDPASYEGVQYSCRGFAFGVYRNDTTGELESFGYPLSQWGSGSVGDILSICIDPVPEDGQQAVQDQFCPGGQGPSWNPNCEFGKDFGQYSLWTDMHICAPWHADYDADYSLPASQQDEMLQVSIDELQAMCVERCEVVFSDDFLTNVEHPISGQTYTLDHVECAMYYPVATQGGIIKGEPEPLDESYEWGQPSPKKGGPSDCAQPLITPENHGVQHDLDAQGDLVPETCSDCYSPSDEEVYVSYDCSGYNPGNIAGHTQGAETTTSWLDLGGMLSVLSNGFQVYICDQGRYDEYATDTWAVQDASSGTLLYQLGFRNRDENISARKFNPSTYNQYGPTYDLDSVAGMTSAFANLIDEDYVAFTLDRNGSEHTVYVTVVEL